MTAVKLRSGYRSECHLIFPIRHTRVDSVVVFLSSSFALQKVSLFLEVHLLKLERNVLVSLNGRCNEVE